MTPEEIKSFVENYPDVQISKCKVTKKFLLSNLKEIEAESNAEMYILFGGLTKSNPKQYMDEVVAQFVGTGMYNEFVESSNDNPWIRIIIFGFNALIN